MCPTIGEATHRWTMHAGWCAIAHPAASSTGPWRPWSNECWGTGRFPAANVCGWKQFPRSCWRTPASPRKPWEVCWRTAMKIMKCQCFCIVLTTGLDHATAMVDHRLSGQWIFGPVLVTLLKWISQFHVLKIEWNQIQSYSPSSSEVLLLVQVTCQFSQTITPSLPWSIVVRSCCSLSIAIFPGASRDRRAASSNCTWLVGPGCGACSLSLCCAMWRTSTKNWPQRWERRHPCQSCRKGLKLGRRSCFIDFIVQMQRILQRHVTFNNLRDFRSHCQSKNSIHGPRQPLGAPRICWSTSSACAVCTRSPIATSKHVTASSQCIWCLLIWNWDQILRYFRQEPKACEYCRWYDQFSWKNGVVGECFCPVKLVSLQSSIPFAPVGVIYLSQSVTVRILLWIFQRSMQPFLDPGPHWLCCRLSIAEMAADSVAVIESDCRWKPALTASGDMVSTNNHTHPCNISIILYHFTYTYLPRFSAVVCESQDCVLTWTMATESASESIPKEFARSEGGKRKIRFPGRTPWTRRFPRCSSVFGVKHG